MLFPSIGNIDCLVFMGKKKEEKNNDKINVEESLVQHSTTLFLCDACNHMYDNNINRQLP